VYPGAARLDDLATAVKAAHPGSIRTVTVDLTRYSGPGLAKGWLPEDVPGGYVTPIEPLIMDGGRSKPDETDPPRTSTPGLDAGRALASRLGADKTAVTSRPAPAGAAVLGEVRSPPIATLVETALRISDNVLAETLAREVAVSRGGEASFTGATREVLATLREAGLDPGGATVHDGSGLSTGDQVPARLLGEIMAAAARPTGATTVSTGTGTRSGTGTRPDGTAPVSGPAERAERLRPLLAGLPVAGGDGTLDDRFVSGPSAPGRGWVRAKTGTLTGVSSLAGVVVDADGRLLVFALMSNGTSPTDSRPRLDAVAAALRACGCR
jgi:D-alanyl-D-alanine carboxypeptidase/D-alanyl-D-alanine-endopeptidase (penicillin-binding protein 4)